MILQLPVDLLVELQCWLPTNDLCNLRLACKRLGDILAPHVFKKVVIDLREPRLGRDLEKLQALADGYPLAVQGARRLSLRWLDHELPSSLQPRPASLMSAEGVRGILDATLIKGLSTLSGLKSIRQAQPRMRYTHRLINNCTCSLQPILGDENEHIRLGLSHLSLGFSGLRVFSFRLTPQVLSQPFPSSLPSLHRLRVTFQITSQSDAAKAVTELGRLVKSSPFLSYLNLERYTYERRWSFPSPYGGNFLPHADPTGSSATSLPIRHLHISSIPFPTTGFMHHFQHLTSLSLELRDWLATPPYITDPHDPEDPQLSNDTCRRDLWQNLLQAKIYLESIEVDYPCDDFLRYMASYSSLRHLTLRIGNQQNPAEEDKAALQFYQIALPHHAGSLVKLHIHPSYEGDWSFSTDNWDTIKRCTNLTELSLDVHCGRGGPVYRPTDLTEIITSISLHLPKVAQLSLRDASPAWMRNVICAYGYDVRANARRLHTEACAYRASPGVTKLPNLRISSLYRYKPATEVGEDGQCVLRYEVVENLQRSFAPWGIEWDDSE